MAERTYGERSEKVVLYEKIIYNIGLSGQNITGGEEQTYSYNKVSFSGDTLGTVDTAYVLTFGLTCPTLDEPLSDVVTVIFDFSGSGHYKF